jgi:hypothetical protein
MDKQTMEKKARLGFEWIKSQESGISYLCPVGSIDRKNATEAQLKQACVDESKNPQND